MIRSHLTVVDNDSPAASSRPRRLSADANGQFEFELDGGEIRCFLIVAMDEVHGSKLLAELERHHPAIVLDLRSILRFDQPGISRSAFFRILSRTHSHYMREPVIWGDIQLRHMNASTYLPARLYHETVERWEGNVALLVSKIAQAKHLEALLNLTLSQRRPTGWGIEQVR